MTGPGSLASSELLAAYGLDLAVGDPAWLPHPVRLMGRIITRAEQVIRRPASTASGQRVAGIVLAVSLPVSAYVAGWLVLAGAGAVHPWLHVLAAVYLASTTLSVRSLHEEAGRVAGALEGCDLAAARSQLSRIVGRETAQLDEGEVVRAAVETVAESTCDGIVAPLFYLWLGGVPLALAYKAVNTLDSMVGHPNPPYRSLGWASARLDDVANYLPARLTGFLIAVAAIIRAPSRLEGEGWGEGVGRGRQAWRVMRRDGRKHESPNSGVSEAAMAGALGIQLGGRTLYRAGVRSRPLLGEPARPLEPVRIREAIRMSRWVAALMVVCALLGRAALSA